MTREVLELDNRLGWRLKAGSRGTHKTRYFSAEYSINSLGYRDAERRESKGAGTRRVLMLGDSQVFGWGVAAESRFSNLIEKSQAGWEVWNLAVPGYGLDQEVLAFEKARESAAADEAVFFVTGSILRRAATDYIFFKYKPRFEPDEAGGLRLVSVPDGRTSLMSAARAVLGPLYLPYFLETRFSQLQALSKSGRRGGDERRDPLTELEKRLLLRLKSPVESRGMRVKLLVNLRPPFREEVERFARANGIGFLMLDIDIREPGVIFSREDPHWTAATHREVARQMLAQWE
jgi:hypothetical protein